jgi:hypothetical protein
MKQPGKMKKYTFMEKQKDYIKETWTTIENTISISNTAYQRKRQPVLNWRLGMTWLKKPKPQKSCKATSGGGGGGIMILNRERERGGGGTELSLSVPWRHAMRADVTGLFIHNFGAKWRWVVTSIPQLQYLLQISLGGPQSW